MRTQKITQVITIMEDLKEELKSNMSLKQMLDTPFLRREIMKRYRQERDQVAMVEFVADFEPPVEQAHLHLLTGVSTKRESYEKSLKTASALHQQIITILKRNPGISRARIATLMGIRIQTVTARVRELLDANEIEECGTVYDTDSERKVKILKVKD